MKRPTQIRRTAELSSRRLAMYSDAVLRGLKLSVLVRLCTRDVGWPCDRNRSLQ